MTISRTSQRDEGVSSVFLRAIGSLALASHELDHLRADRDGDDSWRQFADHLAESSSAVMDGAANGSFPGNTIAILRQGVRVSVDLEHIERLTEKIRRHVKVGRMLGLDDQSVEGTELTRTA